MCETLHKHNSIQYLEPPDRLENDNSSYRLISLNNGLKALLITNSLCDSDSESNCSDGNTVKYEDSIKNSNSKQKRQQKIEKNLICNVKRSFRKNDDNIVVKETEDDVCTDDINLATAALLVDVGSFNDPPKIKGLAHLVEHVLFMGSKKYPTKNEFHSFITKNCGDYNGETGCESTNYYFTINDDNFEAALDRFIDMFCTPLMLKETILNEINIIESEFRLAMQNDRSRREQILASITKPEHPFSSFGWGNLISFKEHTNDDELHNAVNEFLSRYYSSERMYLCLKANRKMDELEDLVIKYFSNIPKRNSKIEDFSSFNYKNVFGNEFFENVIFVTPVQNINCLEITFCLPSIINEYKFKPHHYIAYILSHKGCGSLCAYLRKKLWGLEIESNIPEDICFQSNSIYCLLVIRIHLTEEGINRLEDVLEVTFAYIKMILKHGPDEDLFNELKILNENSALKESETYPNETIPNLKYFPPKDILTATKLIFDYNPNSIWNIIKIMNDNKFNLMITTKKPYKNIKYDKKEKWFGTEFGIMKMPKEWLELWDNCKTFSELLFPKENQYILDYEILTFFDDNNDNDDHNFDDNDDDIDDEQIKYPKKILNIDVCQLWFKQKDNNEGNLWFSFLTPLSIIHPRNEILLEIWIELVKYKLFDKFKETAHIDVTFTYNIYLARRGFSLEINGYAEKLFYLIDTITKIMNDIVGFFTKDEIYVVINELQNDYKNRLIDPDYLIEDIGFGILENIWWFNIEKYNLIKYINYEQIEAFAMLLFREIHIKALIQGNFLQNDAIRMIDLTLDNLCCLPMENQEKLRIKICKLPLGSNFLICKSFNCNDVNTIVMNIYQIDEYTIKNKCILDLIRIIIAEPIFQILRNNEQLTYYAAEFNVRSYFNTLNYSITIKSQENKFNSNYIEQRIESFHKQIPNIVNNLTQDEYLVYRKSLLQAKSYYEDLNDEGKEYYDEYPDDTYVFDRNDKEIDHIKQITKNDILEFLNIQMNKIRKLSIQIVGHKLSSDCIPELNISVNDDNDLHLIFDDNSIKDIKMFKNDLELYS